MRQRLSWDQGKVAEISKQADPYTMNQDHKNNPIEKYESYDTSKGKEDPDTRTPWKNEGRSEVGLPSPAAKAVQAARILEDKALKCITIAARVLPGASDDLIEKQATDFMYMPDSAIIATLQRQAELAEVLSKECKNDDEDAEKPVKPIIEAKTEEKKDDEDAEKPVKPVIEAKTEEKKDDEDAEKPVKPVIEAKTEEKKDDEDAEKPVKPVIEAAEETVEASIDLLDQIFAESAPKTGAKKLSGIVKQASVSQGMSLDSLWSSSTPPDVSKAFR